MNSFIELENDFKTKVILCNIGASIYDIKTPNKDGVIESILYTPLKREKFFKDNSYFGKTIGRTGGRISNSTFNLNGIDYTIPSNDKNGLHGGIDSISFKEFEWDIKKTDEYTMVDFYCYSPHLESGYPGNLKLHIYYKLYKKINKLEVKYNALSDMDTLLNLSNHAYFNLSGNAKEDILNHKLFIASNKMERIENLLPQEVINCSDIYSFNNMHKIGDNLFNDEIINNTNGYDFPYIFDECDINKYNIILKEDNSKRVLKIKTSYPCVVVYTCNYAGKTMMNNDKKMMPYYAVCLECMYHPNTINSDFLSDKKDILKKNKEYNEIIEYYFEVEND